MRRRPPRSTRTDTLVPYTTLFRSKLIKEVATLITSAPNDVIVRGHTDALPYAKGRMANNWTLSTFRAEATRQALMRSEEHTSELQSLMRISYAVFCLKKTTTANPTLRYSHLQLSKANTMVHN